MKNYLDKLNYAETEEQILKIVRSLPIGHFRSLVKCVGIVIDEFSKMTDATIEENNNWHKREMPRCKSSQLPPVDVDIMDWVSKGFGITTYCSEQKKEKLRLKEHKRLEEEKKNHIYLNKEFNYDEIVLPKPNNGETVTKAG